MRDIIQIEKRRVLNSKLKVILLILFLIYSIIMGISLLKNYDVYDNEGNKIISARENLKKSKDKYAMLDEKIMKDLVNGKDKSKYLYNKNLLILLTLDDAVEKVESIDKKLINDFYKNRLVNLKSELKRAFSYTDNEITWIYDKAKKIDNPMKVGYSEGWKNLNNDLKYTVPIILIIVSLVVLQIFGEEPKVKMTELYKTTQYGKNTLLKSRAIAGIELGLTIYICGIFIFSLVYFVIFGVKGFDIPIQNSYTFFYSSYNITFFEQYLINVGIGLISTLLIISFVYLFTSFSKDLLIGLVLTSFLWVTMLIVPRNFVNVNHNFSNFLPYKMTDFSEFYITNEIYTVFGKVVYAPVLISVVSIILILVMISLSYVLLSRDLKKYIKD